MINNKIMAYKFIAFEGPEGAGKGTQIASTKKYFSESNINIYTTAEPTKGPIGKLIRQALSGEIKLPLEALQILFTADRIHHQEEITRELQYSHVITDRYYGSTLTYILTKKVSDDFYEAIKELNISQRKPDIWVYLRCTVEESIASVAKRNDTPEIFDGIDKMEKTLRAYDEFFNIEENNSTVIIIERNGRSIEEINEELIQKLKEQGIF